VDGGDQMKMWTGKHYWEGGFENEFEVFPTRKNLNSEIKRSAELSWVWRTVITDEKGNVIYDEQKETPMSSKGKGTGASKKAESKKAVRKKDGIADESKRRVCRPQDI